MDTTTLAYLAGFIDGEGSIAIGLNKNPRGDRRWYLRFSCHQLNPAPLNILSSLFGGSVRYHGFDKRRDRKIYEWVTTADMAYNAIKALRPHLIVKADEADAAIEFQEALKRGKGSRTRLTVEEEEYRNSAYLAMRALKQRTYEPESTQ